MEEVVIVVYYDGDMRPHFKGLLFECPNGLKFSKISEEMPLASLGKAVTNAIRGDGCVEYDYMELNDNHDVGKISKGSIELYAMIGQSREETLALLCKPKSVKEIITLMRGSMTTTSSSEVDNFV
ncbi:hypothetical protein GmHk_05G012710 [Glycine max]|nr:hypothetical protein GmHk_05G012710 [Glycine max]